MPPSIEELETRMKRHKAAYVEAEKQYTATVQALADARVAKFKRDYRSWMQRFDWSLGSPFGSGTLHLSASTGNSSKNRTAFLDVVRLLCDPQQDPSTYMNGRVQVEDWLTFEFGHGVLCCKSTTNEALLALCTDLGLSVNVQALHQDRVVIEEQIKKKMDEQKLFTKALDLLSDT